MLFKVAFANIDISSDVPIISRSDIIDNIIKVEVFDNYYCFKIKNEHNYSRQGVIKTDESTIPADQFIKINDGKTLITLGFILVNYKNNRIYYHGCNNKIFSKIMEGVFHLPHYNINYQVDSEKLTRIEKLTIEAKRPEQINYMYNEIHISSDMEKELDIMDSPADTVTLSYEYGRGGIAFNNRKLKSVIEKYDDISIKGYDNNNNPIFIKDIIQLGIDLDLDSNTYEKIDNLQFSEIVAAINNKEKETLYEY